MRLNPAYTIFIIKNAKEFFKKYDISFSPNTVSTIKQHNTAFIVIFKKKLRVGSKITSEESPPRKEPAAYLHPFTLICRKNAVPRKRK
jgi:hypothetical protein